MSRNENNSTFATKIGVIAATVGSAVGLGNVWRFPSLAQENGGAAFLVVYLLSMLIMGIPVMLAETSLGRAGRSDSVGVFRRLTPGRRWWIVGVVGIVASYIILSYYMVVAGWTLEYIFQSATGWLFEGTGNTATDSTLYQQKMSQMIATGWNPLLWTYIVIILNLLILLKGVQKGIEKMSNIMMPMLFVILLIFVGVALTLPAAHKGLEFFLKPDFGKIDIDVVMSALGQAFFSMSLGMGILVTYSSYYPSDVKLTSTAFTVTGLNFMVAFLMSLIIFPAVMSFNVVINPENLSGTTLVFVTLPEVFNYMDMPRFWAVLFFALLFLAAITSTISIAEVSIAFVRDRFKTTRLTACLVVLLPIFATSAVCSLSLGAVPWLKIAGMTVFDFLDAFTTNILLPISAFCICIYVGWVLRKKFLKDELTNYGSFPSRLAPAISFLIKWVCPILIAAIFISYIISLF